MKTVTRVPITFLARHEEEKSLKVGRDLSAANSFKYANGGPGEKIMAGKKPRREIANNSHARIFRFYCVREVNFLRFPARNLRRVCILCTFRLHRNFRIRYDIYTLKIFDEYTDQIQTLLNPNCNVIRVRLILRGYIQMRTCTALHFSLRLH